MIAHNSPHRVQGKQMGLSDVAQALLQPVKRVLALADNMCRRDEKTMKVEAVRNKYVCDAM